jgi:hypothetical protein
MRNGIEYPVLSLHVAADSALWLEQESGGVMSMATSEVVELPCTGHVEQADWGLTGLFTGGLKGSEVAYPFDAPPRPGTALNDGGR